MIERWIVIERFPRYAVSNLGNVWDRMQDRLLVQTADRAGYLRVKLAFPNGRMTVSVHRLVVEAFYDTEGVEEWEVNHINGCKTDNLLTNLEVSTRSKNMQHAYNTGLVRLPNETPVQCVETGQVFRTMREAARFVGASDHKSIVRVLNNPNRTCKGFHFESLEGG